MTVNLLDAHVYVCKRAVLDVLAQKPHLDSIREEFVPWLCKVHTQKTKRAKYGNGAQYLPLGSSTCVTVIGQC